MSIYSSYHIREQWRRYNRREGLQTWTEEQQTLRYWILEDWEWWQGAGTHENSMGWDITIKAKGLK